MTESTVENVEVETFGTELATRHIPLALFEGVAKDRDSCCPNQSAALIKPRLTTEELAALLCVKPQTIRAGLCKTGHYLGIRPAVKLPNRRLLWDSKAALAVINH